MSIDAYKKHNRRKGIARLDDFKMHPEDKIIIEQFAEESTNLSNPIQQIDTNLLSDLQDIMNQIKNSRESEELSILNRKKVFRQQLLFKIFQRKQIVTLTKKNKKSSENLKTSAENTKEKKLKKSETTKNVGIKKKKAEIKVKRISFCGVKKQKFKSLNLPPIALKSDRKPSSSIEFKSNFLV